jgi:hypothetical protein
MLSLVRLLVPAALLALSPGVFPQTVGQLPTEAMVVADILATPDELRLVRSITPGTFSAGKAILSTPVDYLRGLVFDGPASGWYVSGNADTGTATGFYRFENGRSTRVAPFPLTRWGSLADASWSRDRDFIWYLWNPSGLRRTSLYRIDFDGTFTLVGEIHEANGTKFETMGGIALDAPSGLLYGYDQTTADLLTIDVTTAEATRVGPTGLAPYPQTVIMSHEHGLLARRPAVPAAELRHALRGRRHHGPGHGRGSRRHVVRDARVRADPHREAVAGAGRVTAAASARSRPRARSGWPRRSCGR